MEMPFLRYRPQVPSMNPEGPSYNAITPNFAGGGDGGGRASFIGGLQSLGYAGPMLGTPEMRAAHQAGQHPIRDFMAQYRTDNPGSHPWMQAMQNYGGFGGYEPPHSQLPGNGGIVPPDFQQQQYQNKFGQQYANSAYAAPSGLAGLTSLRPRPFVLK